MARTVSSPILQLIRRVCREPRGEGSADQALLRWFVAERNEAAFETLLRRHGAMVLDVCRGVLGNEADVEDAFQATFLILVRRAESIRKGASLACWLHGVAYRTALRARADGARRRRHETRTPQRCTTTDPDELTWREIRQVVHEELDRLPERHRAALVLCYLQGKTQDEAAAELGLPKGTLKGHLERGRSRLQARLVRRGLGPGVVLTLAAWPAATKATGLSDSLVRATVKTVIAFAAGKAAETAATGAISVKVTVLTEGVMKAMLFAKLRAAIAVLLILGFVATGATILTLRVTAGQDDKKPAAEKPVEPTAKPEKQKDKETVTAWGKEVGGLQAGLGFRPGEKRFYHHGETATVVLRVRNVGKEAVEFKHIGAFFVENPPTITDADGKMVELPKFRAEGKQAPHSTNVAPGKEIDLYDWGFDLQPKGGINKELFTIHGTGKFSVQCERVVGPTSGNPIHPNPALSKLATGKLELEISAAAPPPAAKEEAKTGNQSGADAEARPGADSTRPIRSLRGHVNRLLSVAYSPDGKSIATASWDGTVRIWNATTGEEVRRLGLDKGTRLQTEESISNTFDQIAFSPDNAFLVTVKRGSTASPQPPPAPPPDKTVVIVWDPRTGEKLRTFPADGASFAISPDGKLIACGGYQVIHLYELATGKRFRELHGGKKQLEIVSLTFSPDSKTLISTGRPPTPQRDDISPLAIFPDALRLWDMATGKERPSALNGVVVGRHGRPRIAFSKDGRTVIHASEVPPPGGSGYDISLREVATGGERARLACHKADLCAFALSPDGRTLASGSMDGTVRLWDLLGGKEVGRLGKEVDPIKGGWVLAVAFSPDGRTLVSGGLDKTAHVWDVSRITSRRRKPAERSSADLEADWKGLAGDVAAGYAALGRLVSSPQSAVAFLAKQLQNTKHPDTKRIERLIADLDDERFQVREQASKELEELAEYAAPALRKALGRKPSLEVKRWLEALLHRLNGGGSLSAETVRHIRAVEALEAIGNPEARQLLDKLAAGPSEMRLTQEAQAAVRRLPLIGP
jgi:RNA polymerase sigma factor (sigma-70 family)